MASQWLTVSKLSGAAGEAVVSRFRAWHETRFTDSYGDEQWPRKFQEEADRLADGLKGDELWPPVLFHSRFLDLWSMGDVYREVLGPTALEIETQSRSMLAFDLSNREQLLDEVSKRLQRRDQADEYRWYWKNLREAATAWDGVVTGGVIVVIREVLTGLVEDHEIQEGQNRMPDWINGDA